jgi:hypothetical protein
MKKTDFKLQLQILTMSLFYFIHLFTFTKSSFRKRL